jgi:hypothetical protein
VPQRPELSVHDSESSKHQEEVQVEKRPGQKIYHNSFQTSRSSSSGSSIESVSRGMR